MKALVFVFAILFAIVASVAQANTTTDTIPAGKVSYQPTLGGKILNIKKDSSVIITGVDSVVVVAKDTAKHSEKVAVYVNGKVTFTDWLKEGYTSQPDPADTTGKKVIIVATGGDEDDPSTPWYAIAWYWWVSIVSVVIGGLYIAFRWW